MQERETYQVIDFRGENLEEVWILTVDSITDEVISERQGKNQKDTSNYFRDKGEFFTMHRRMCNMLKTKKNYNNLTFRLLFELLSRVERNNRIASFTQEELAQVLGSQQQNICVSLKVLKADNVVQKIKHDYYLSPQFVRFIMDEMPKFNDVEKEEKEGAENEE